MRCSFPSPLALALLALSACDSGEPPPDAVELAGGLTDLSLEATLDTVLVDVAPAFRSAVPLTYAALVLPAEAATATLEGTRLKLVGKQAGTATVRVTARNESGGSATATFGLTITPQGIVQYDALPTGSVLRVGRDSLMVRFSNYFRQSAGLSLTYAVESTSGPVTAQFVESDYLKIKPTGDGVGRVVMRVSAANKRDSTALVVNASLFWCPAVPNQRLYGVPRSGDRWRFSYAQTDQTSTQTDSLRAEAIWNISGGSCRQGVQTFDVDETRTGTRTTISAGGARTISPLQETRRFTMVFDEGGASTGINMTGKNVSYGPYSPTWTFANPFSQSSSNELTTGSDVSLGPLERVRYSVVLSLSGGLESITYTHMGDRTRHSFVLLRQR
ncbi:MAG TPA: hypothetical protein VD948_06480 [Rhodothermales bacterium]|nr:hypothetical protein [Rhodothermales bacterium]